MSTTGIQITRLEITRIRITNVTLMGASEGTGDGVGTAEVMALPAPGEGWHLPAIVARPADRRPAPEPAALGSATIATLLGQTSPRPGAEPATTAAILRAGPPAAWALPPSPALPAPPVCWTLERSAA